MQDTITKNESGRISKALLNEELDSGDVDITTSEGRRRRSKKNLQHLTEVHHDCPEALLQELTNTMLRKQCTLEHLIWDIKADPHSIIQSGMLLSNEELRQKGVSKRGGTKELDLTEFGNHDFLFTRPIFHDVGQPIEIDEKHFCFYVPVDDVFLDNYPWLSFKDWAGMRKDEYLHNKQDGKHIDDKRLHSIYYDFFVGKKDIAQAVAYKVFEAMKTAMILYKDENHARGFNLEKARKFLEDVNGLPDPYLENSVINANTLLQPINSYTLSEKQKAFLLDGTNPERNAMLKSAFDGILHVLSKAGELKVPVALSLDGATIGGRYLTTDVTKPNQRKYRRFIEGKWADVAPESFQTMTISPQMPFERKVAGFECPD